MEREPDQRLGTSVKINPRLLRPVFQSLCLLVVTEVCARERADQKGQPALEAAGRTVLPRFLSPRSGLADPLPSAGELLHLEQDRDPVQTVMGGQPGGLLVVKLRNPSSLLEAPVPTVRMKGRPVGVGS